MKVARRLMGSDLVQVGAVLNLARSGQRLPPAAFLGEINRALQLAPTKVRTSGARAGQASSRSGASADLSRAVWFLQTPAVSQ